MAKINVHENLKKYSLSSFTALPTGAFCIRECVGCHEVKACGSTLNEDSENFGLCLACAREIGVQDLNRMKVDGEIPIGTKCDLCKGAVKGQAVTRLCVGGKIQNCCQQHLGIYYDKVRRDTI